MLEKEQQVELEGVKLTNFGMGKFIDFRIGKMEKME